MRDTINKTEIIQIRAICGVIRDWLVTHAQRIKSKDFDFVDLGCMCAYSSTIVFAVLEQYKEFAPHLIFHYGDHHCYLQYKSYLLDLTATQFGAEHEIVFQPMNKPIKGLYHTDLHEYFNSKTTQKLTSLDDIFETVSNEYPTEQYFNTRTHLKRVLTSVMKKVEQL